MKKHPASGEVGAGGYSVVIVGLLPERDFYDDYTESVLLVELA